MTEIPQTMTQVRQAQWTVSTKKQPKGGASGLASDLKLSVAQLRKTRRAIVAYEEQKLIQIAAFEAVC